MQTTPFFETERCVIRAFAQEDIVPFMAYRNDAHWMRFQGFKGLTQAAYEAALLPAPDVQAGMQLAIVRKADDCLLGDLYVKAQGDGYAIGYTLHPRHTGHGYAREAVTGLVGWLWARGNGAVFASVMPGNEASLALLKALAFQPEGTDAEGDLCFCLRWHTT